MKTTNYRKRGLGSFLLKFLIHSARSKGVKQIFGWVVERDLAHQTHLLRWYRKYGFQVVAPTPEAPPDTVAKIYLDIHSG